MTDKNDWNPGFQRKKKRNRVNRGVPGRGRRRYYFWPCALLVGLTALFRLGVAGQLISLAGFDTIRVHVSYNQLNEHSKWRSPDGRYLLGGTANDDIYECQVSQEFWERVEENSHVSIPSKQCRLIDPTVTISGSLPLRNETGGGVVVLDGQTLQYSGTILSTPATSNPVSITPSNCTAVLKGQARVGGQVSGQCVLRQGGGSGDLSSSVTGALSTSTSAATASWTSDVQCYLLPHGKGVECKRPSRRSQPVTE